MAQEKEEGEEPWAKVTAQGQGSLQGSGISGTRSGGMGSPLQKNGSSSDGDGSDHASSESSDLFGMLEVELLDIHRRFLAGRCNLLQH